MPLGYALLAAGIGVTAWAQAVNRFFEPGVRIQTDRGQGSSTSAPTPSCVTPATSPLACFSWASPCRWALWALVPAGLASLLLIVRTRWEDRTLQAELAGYEDYTRGSAQGGFRGCGRASRRRTGPISSERAG